MRNLQSNHQCSATTSSDVTFPREKKGKGGDACTQATPPPPPPPQTAYRNLDRVALIWKFTRSSPGNDEQV